MTREEAIERLNIHKSTSVFVDSIAEAIDMAIEALQDDVVSREEAIQAIDKCRERKNKEIEQLREFYSQKPTIPMFAESEEAYKAWTGEEMGRPHGRLIDADKLKKQLDTVYNEMANERERKGLRLARWFLISEPTVSADRPHGEWIIRDDMPKLDNTYSIECSECGQLMFGHYNADNPNYCCNCGARMTPYKGGEDE